jgi:hypothetical protein
LPDFASISLFFDPKINKKSGIAEPDLPILASHPTKKNCLLN